MLSEVVDVTGIVKYIGVWVGGGGALCPTFLFGVGGYCPSAQTTPEWCAIFPQSILVTFTHNSTKHFRV